MLALFLITVLATAVAVAVFNLCIRHIKQRHQRIVFDSLMKQLSDCPQRMFTSGKREYLAVFVKGKEWGGKNYRIPVQEHWKDVKENEFDWDIFCMADCRTIERFIECNPAITVLNIPTESPDYKTTNCMYKIIRVK